MARVINRVTATNAATKVLGPGGNCEIYVSGAVDVRIGTEAEVTAGNGRTVKAGRSLEDKSGVTDTWYVKSTGGDSITSHINFKG